MFKRTISIPAAANSLSWSNDSVLGPIVQMILVLRIVWHLLTKAAMLTQPSLDLNSWMALSRLNYA